MITNAVISQGIFVYLTNDQQKYKIKMDPRNGLKKTTGYFAGDKEKKVQVITSDTSINMLSSTEFIQLFMSSKPPLAVTITPNVSKAHISEDKTKSIDPSLRSYIVIKGLSKIGKYKISINPDKIEESKAYIKQGEKKIDVKVNSGNLQGIDKKQLGRIFLESVKNLKIEVSETDNKEIQFNLTVKSFELAATSKKAAKSTLSVKNTQQLVKALKAGHPDKELKKIVENIVFQFTQCTSPSYEDIEEVAELLKVTNPDQTRRIIEHLLKVYKDETISDPHIPKALATIFNNYLRTLYEREYDKTPSNTASLQIGSDPILNLANLLPIAKMLIKKLDDFHVQSGTSTLFIAHHIEAAIAAFQIMVFSEVVDIPKDLHDKFYDVLKKYAAVDDLYIQYLSRYSRQTLNIITDNESKMKMFFRHVYHFAKGFNKMAEVAETKSPIKAVESIGDSLPEFKKAFTFKADREKQWFCDIAILQGMRYQDINKFFDKITEEGQAAIINADNAKDPMFMMGLITIIWSILQRPTVKKEIAEQCLDFLQKIFRDNYSDKGKYRIEDEICRRQLYTYILELFASCREHGKKEIRKKAIAIIQGIESEIGTLMLDSNQEVESDISNKLFSNAVLSTDPLRDKYQTIIKALESDPQVLNEQEYYIPLEAKESQFDISTEPLHKKIVDFIQNDSYSTLVISGEAGAGKSFSTKLEALDQWYSYNPGGYIFIRVSLAQIDNPFKDLLKKALKENGIDIFNDLKQALKMKDEKIVWIFDAYDEIHFKNEKEKNTSLCDINRFYEWPNSKFIFTCKSSVHDKLDKKVFKSQRGACKVLYVAPFDETKIDVYLRNFVNIRRKKTKKEPALALPEKWSYKKYKSAISQIKTIENMTKDILSNPLYLKITTEVLPFIEARYKEEGDSAILNVFGPVVESVKIDLFDAYACVLAKRSSIKCAAHPDAGELKLTAVDFLQYSVDVAKAMVEYGEKWIKWNESHTYSMSDKVVDDVAKQLKQFNFNTEDVKKLGAATAAVPQDFIEPSEEEKRIRELFTSLLDESGENFRNHFLKKECLVYRDGKWGFRHNDFYTYFSTIEDRIGGFEKLKTMIEEDVFKFDQVYFSGV